MKYQTITIVYDVNTKDETIKTYTDIDIDTVQRHCLAVILMARVSSKSTYLITFPVGGTITIKGDEA